MTSNSPNTPSAGRTKATEQTSQESEKWFNEYPLEGDPNRPAVVIVNLLSKSPRLIGWDDEEIEQIALDANPNVGYGQEEEIHIGPKREEVNEIAFGLLGIAAKEVAKNLLHFEERRNESKQQADTSKVDDEKTNETAVDKVMTSGLSDNLLSKEMQENAESASNMRDTELYQLAFRSLLWQRDNYLVGKAYADERGAQRRRQKQALEKQHVDTSVGLPFSRMPYDSTALGNIQLARLGQWFIPSPVVHRSLLPIVLGLPTGALHQPILKATANLIPMSQNNLNHVMKSRILWFLQDESWRGVIKDSTQGYIANTYRDS